MAHTVILELNALRARGVCLLAILGWGCVASLALIGWAVGSDNLMPVLLFGIAANITPTIMALRHRYDSAARMTVGTLAAIYPALGVYLLKGHPWQMDGHMYFFVALAALIILCDWKPIALASVLIAIHHLLLQFIAPYWVFNTTSGDLDRVVIHAVAVILQFAVMTHVAINMQRLLKRQAEARQESERLAAESVNRRLLVENAMTAQSDAERLAAEERTRREQVEYDLSAARRTEMVDLANAFQQSVADVVEAVGKATAELNSSAESLNRLAKQANSEANETAVTASQSSASAQTLAGRIRDLSSSIASIAASVDQQALLSETASATSGSGYSAVLDLTNRTTTIAGFAESIDEIASRTNLLALNATIEAARAGEVGRGFAVVANEVKQLASQASSATGEIRSLARSVQDGAEHAHQALKDMTAMVRELSHAADSISNSVEHQRDTTMAIETAAQDTASGAVLIAEKIVALGHVSSDTEQLSSRVADAANALSVTARELQTATLKFVDHLKAA